MKVVSTAVYESLPKTLSWALRNQLMICRALHFAANPTTLRLVA